MRARRKVRFFAGILICAILAPLWSQSDWQGSAVVGRYGEFPPNGLYAASSAFPLNSLVDVTNPETGERARVVVVRELNDPGVFMVVSEAAAQQLGLDFGDSTTVRGTPVQLPGLTAVSPNQDLPFHPDPDVNPAATFGDPNAALVMPPEPGRLSEDSEGTAVVETLPELEVAPPGESERAAVAAPIESRTSDEPAVADQPVMEELAMEEPAQEELAMEEPTSDQPIAEEVSPEIAAEPEIEEDSLSVSTPAEPPESDPLPITELEVPDTPVGESEPTPTVPEVRIVVDVPEREAPPPNPVQVRATIPERESETPRIAEAEAPTMSDTTEDEVVLPLVAVSDAEREPASEPASDPAPVLEETAPSLAEEEILRPGLIPENAIVSLEPAGFRSPDPPPEPEPTPEPEPEAEPEAEPEVASAPDDADQDDVGEPEPEKDGEVEAEDRLAQAEPESEPEAEPEPEPKTTEMIDAASDDGATASLPLVDRLDDGASYVQVAAFSTPQSVRQTIDSLSGGWPVAVMAQKSGDRSVYRVYVGPLAEDEKGSVLYRVRNEGFRDAFVR